MIFYLKLFLLQITFFNFCQKIEASENDDIFNFKKLVIDDAVEQYKDVIVHLSDWKYKEIAKECKELSEIGYVAVQISPVTAHAYFANHPWDERLSVISYTIETSSGKRDDLEQMITECNKNKIKVYADIVINNMARSTDIKENGETFANEVYTYSDTRLLYTTNDFHEKYFTCDLSSDKETLWKCIYDGRHDLKQINSKTKKPLEPILNLIQELAYCGIEGFRILGAEFMDPKHLNETYKWLPRKKYFIYHDVFNPYPKIREPNRVIQPEDYAKNGRVTDYRFTRIMSRTFLSRKEALKNTVISSKEFDLIPSEDSVVFVNNFATLGAKDTAIGLTKLDDNDKFICPFEIDNIQNTTNKVNQSEGIWHRIISSIGFEKSGGESVEFEVAIAFMLSTNNGIPLITSSFKKPSRDDHNNEHKWDTVKRMVQFRYLVKKSNKGLIPTASNVVVVDSNQITYCLEKTAFVAINNADPEKPLNKQINTCFQKAGIYCDIFGGGIYLNKTKCQGKSMNVTSNGLGSLNMETTERFAAFHVDHMLNNS